jgi:hypothetical protein
MLILPLIIFSLEFLQKTIIKTSTKNENAKRKLQIHSMQIQTNFIIIMQTPHHNPTPLQSKLCVALNVQEPRYEK